jgi:hypothetical protein
VKGTKNEPESLFLDSALRAGSSKDFSFDRKLLTGGDPVSRGRRATCGGKRRPFPAWRRA